MWGWCFQRDIHSRNKKAMEFVAKGWSALKEVDRVIDYCELNDERLIPLLRVLYASYSFVSRKRKIVYGFRLKLPLVLVLL